MRWSIHQSKEENYDVEQFQSFLQDTKENRNVVVDDFASDQFGLKLSSKGLPNWSTSLVFQIIIFFQYRYDTFIYQ